MILLIKKIALKIITVFIRIQYTCRGKYYKLMDKIYSIYLSSKFKDSGQNIYLYYPIEISGLDFVQIGNNVHINRGAFIRAEGGLIIGNNVHIARNLVIYTINHNYLGNALPYDNTMIKKTVVIGNNVWIGINVTIIPGITIGEGAIIGAGTVVCQDIPPLAIVGSVAPRIIKYRNKEHYEKLSKIKQYGGINGQILKLKNE